MIKKFRAFYDELFISYPTIPQEYAKELEIQRLNINIGREIILSILLICIAAFLLFGDFLLINIAWGGIQKEVKIIHHLMINLPILFLISMHFIKKKVNNNYFLANAIHLFLVLAVLFLCALIGVTSSSWRQPFSYIVSIFSVASMVLLSRKERIYIYMSSYCIYISGVQIFHRNEHFVFGNNAFIFLLVIAAILISKSNYASFIKNYINDRVISEKNIELDILNRITEETLKKRTEELNNAVEYERLRTNFFANISHELRTPLTVIYSAQQMLDLSIDNPKTIGKDQDLKRYTHIIKQNCYRLLRLISNLIDITKLDAGYIKPNLVNYNIIKAIKDITLSIDEFIKSKGILLNFSTDIEEAVIAIDLEMIDRIMLNLLSNAVKFTPGGGSISVKISDGGDKINISIKDTGIGISDHMQSLVFERFVQANPTSTRQNEGSGIGLSLVKSLVDLHDGTIILKSKEGSGTEFIIGLPKNVLPADATLKNNDFQDVEDRIKKISIEFSDIYT
jgi:signal transduction histidine kinase